MKTVFTMAVIAILFLSNSCSNETSVAQTGYFDITAFLNTQLKVLYQKKYELDKTSVVDDKSDMYSLKDVDWSKELQMFYNSDINKKSLTNKYFADTTLVTKDSLQQIKISYLAKDSSLFTKQLDVYFRKSDHEVVCIQIKNSTKNFFSANQMYLIYIPMREIAISIHQKKFLGPQNEFKVRGVINHGSNYFQ